MSEGAGQKNALKIDLVVLANHCGPRLQEESGANMHIVSKHFLSVCVSGLSGIGDSICLTWKKVCGRIFPGNEGNAIVEMAFVLPILLTVVSGIYTFGRAFNNQLVLTHAVQEGALTVQAYNGIVDTNPCIEAEQKANAVAVNLNRSNILYTFTYNGGTSVTSCAGVPSTLDSKSSATFSATYPCNLSIYGVPFASSCTLTASSTVPIN